MLAEDIFKEAECGSEPLGLCSPGSCPTLSNLPQATRSFREHQGRSHRKGALPWTTQGCGTPSPQSPQESGPLLCLCSRRACHGCTGTSAKASGCQADPPHAAPACSSCTVSLLATGVLSSRHFRVLLPLWFFCQNKATQL